MSGGHYWTLRPWQTRTHCYRHIFADTNVSLFARARNICCNLCPGHKNVSDFVQKHFVSATNVSQLAQAKKHHEQQCVRNNVSSFARAFRLYYPSNIQNSYTYQLSLKAVFLIVLLLRTTNISYWSTRRP